MKETNWLHFASVLHRLPFAQWENIETQHPTHGRRQAELAAPTPRAPDGKPDLSENDIQHSVGR